MRFVRLAAICGQAAKRLLLAWAESIEPIASEYFGEPAAAVLPLGTVRHHSTTAIERAPWHVDLVFFRPVEGRGVTAWLTFDDVGKTAPGIEFEFEGRSMIPLVPAGAGLMFGPRVKHRTQLIDGDRISVEFRCVPAAMVRDGNDWDGTVAIVEDGRLVTRWRGDVMFSAPIN